MAETTEEMIMDLEESSSLEDMKPDTVYDPKSGSILNFVTSKYNKAETARETEEQRWIKSYQNYRGIYSSDVQFTSTEKSRIFVKVTKTKVLAAYGQIAEVLLGSNKFPLTIDPSKLPDGVEEVVHFETNKDQREALEQNGDSGLMPGETMQDFLERKSELSNTLNLVGDDLQKGSAKTPTAPQFFPAEVAAKKMEKQIHDQLEESHAKKHLRSTAFECALFGTGVMKGPFAIDKEYANWDEEGNYSPVFKTIPQTSNVSIWNFYPDPDATTMEEAEYVIERHKMSRSQMRGLKRRPFFRNNAIDIAIQNGESYDKKWWEHTMEDESATYDTTRFEVLEFWGYVDTEILEQQDVDIPKELKDMDQLSVNVWICNGQVLRLVMNPFTPAYIP